MKSEAKVKTSQRNGIWAREEHVEWSQDEGEPGAVGAAQNAWRGCGVKGKGEL